MVLHSTRGVKLGDALSLTLFILSTNVLSRAKNDLFYTKDFRSFEMPKQSENINHLAYADATIISVSIDDKTLQLIMHTFVEYEKQSGQHIKRGESFLYVSKN